MSNEWEDILGFPSWREQIEAEFGPIFNSKSNSQLNLDSKLKPILGMPIIVNQTPMEVAGVDAASNALYKPVRK